MDIRIIRRRIAPLTIPGAIRFSRRSGIAAIACLCLGTSVFAQSSLDFVDPLSEERSRIEQSAKGTPEGWRPSTEAAPRTAEDSATLLRRAREGASAGASTAQENANSFWGRMKSALSGVAGTLGLSSTGLIGVLTALLAGLALLVGWTLFRGHGKYNAPYDGRDEDDDVYARTRKKTQKRRMPEDMASERRVEKDTPRAATATAAPTFADTEMNAFDNTGSTGFDAILNGDTTPRDAVVELSDPAPASASASDADTEEATSWRKPNLDRLRNSIKSDWMASKKEATPEKPAQSVAMIAEPDSSDPADRSISDIADGWEDWDTQSKPEDDPWGETIARPVEEAAAQQSERDDSAIHRIRALRKSLRAS